MSRLIVVNGPTASGKTAFAIELAQALNTEIVSCDSRQVYKEIPIGTAQPNAEELAAAPHHFIASHNIDQSLSAGEYERQALELLDTLFKKNKDLILVGGSGLYERALCEGMDELPHSFEIREQLKEKLAKEGLRSLQEQLNTLDPIFYKQVDLQNPQRVIRALEVCLASGKAFSELRGRKTVERPFEIVKFGMDIPREALYDRINNRTDIMVQQGWLDEAKTVFEKRDLNPLNTVGYKELFQHLDGKMDLPETVNLIKQNTRRFAKRQLTWYRKDESIQWWSPQDAQGALAHLKGVAQ